MKPEKIRTNPEARLQLNDIGFRLILIPFFGIAIPLLTHMIPANEFRHWNLKLAYGYTILLAFIIWQGNRYLLFSLRSYFNWFNKPLRKILTLLMAVSFFTIPVSMVMLIGWYQLFRNGATDWQVVNTSTLIIMICVLFITHVYETVFLVKESENEMLRNEQLERARTEAELQALKNQVDPHFMFNSLNTLSHLIDEMPAHAKAFNTHLADVYRYILQNRERDLVKVEEELFFLEDYFALQQIRYGGAVQLIVDVPEEIKTQCMMLPISLQLLAENAFKHNEFSVHEPLVITLHAADDHILVSNRSHKKTRNKASLKSGLKNLAERYRHSTGRMVEVEERDGCFGVRLPILKID